VESLGDPTPSRGSSHAVTDISQENEEIVALPGKKRPRNIGDQK
jgi:hypothetical protein